MSRSMIRLLGLGAVAALLAAAAPAMAEPPHKTGDHPRKEMHHGKGGPERAKGKPERGHEHSRYEHYDDRHHRQPEPRRGYWQPSHRDVIVSYYSSHRVSCPPGLVATRTGCLPRGQAKKRYAIGQPLPRTVIIETLPYDLYHRLPPPPRGYIYRRVDGDVLLIAEATKKVIDAIVLFSAL